MQKAKRGTLANGHVRAAAVLVVVSCSTGPREAGETIDFRSDPPPSADDFFGGGVAHASPRDASASVGSDIPDEALMPENPAHVAIRFPKVPEVEVVSLTGEAYPYPYSVDDDDESTVVTLYLPQGIRAGIRARAVVQVGLDEADRPVYDPIYEETGSVDENGDPILKPIEATCTVEPDAKLGTNKLNFGQTHTTITFATGAEQTLTLGENVMDAPVTREHLDGMTRDVMQGVFDAPYDMDCEVDWMGCGELYSFLDGPPVRHTESFILPLRKGQRMGLYPVLTPGSQEIRIHLRAKGE